MVEKDLLIVILEGFQRIARPPEAPVEFVDLELHFLEIRQKMVSASVLAHLVSYNIRMSGFSSLM